MLAYSPRSKDIIMYSSHIMTVAYKYSSEKDLIGLLMCEAFSGGKNLFINIPPPHLESLRERMKLLSLNQFFFLNAL